jgi:hypothetical protein
MTVGARRNQDVAALRVGDRVTSDYHPDEAEIVRTITRLAPGTCSGGVRACANAGDGGTPIPDRPPPVSQDQWATWRAEPSDLWGVSAQWLIPVKE